MTAQPNRGPLPGELDAPLVDAREGVLVLALVILAVLIALRPRRGGRS